MKEDEMLMCLICFVLGYLVARMMRGNGLSVGGGMVESSPHPSPYPFLIGECNLKSKYHNSDDITQQHLNYWCTKFNDNASGCISIESCSWTPVQRPCTCENGTPVSGMVCNYKYPSKCLRCNLGYDLDANQTACNKHIKDKCEKYIEGAGNWLGGCGDWYVSRYSGQLPYADGNDYCNRVTTGACTECVNNKCVA